MAIMMDFLQPFGCPPRKFLRHIPLQGQLRISYANSGALERGRVTRAGASSSAQPPLQLAGPKGDSNMTVQPTHDIEGNAHLSGLSRRGFFVTASAAAGIAFAQSATRAAIVRTDIASLPPYGNGTLPPGIRSRAVANVNGLTVHVLEAGYETAGRSAVLLLHGFPELAFSWRKVMLPLASAGYHVIAPDQRGYGRTTGWDDAYDADPDPFRILNMVRDAIGLVYALGYRSVSTIVGHDAGSPVASWCALIRPDIFRSVTLMSSPFVGAPSLPFNTANGAPLPRPAPTDDEIDAELAKLERPRKYYQNYQRTR